MCGLVCRTSSCKATTCPGCNRALSQFTDTTIVFDGKVIGVSACYCCEGQLFAIWALSCGWQLLPKPSEPKRSSSKMVNKIRSHFQRASKSPRVETSPHPYDLPFTATATAKGVGYGGVDNPWGMYYPVHSPPWYGIQKQVKPSHAIPMSTLI